MMSRPLFWRSALSLTVAAASLALVSCDTTDDGGPGFGPYGPAPPSAYGYGGPAAGGYDGGPDYGAPAYTGYDANEVVANTPPPPLPVYDQPPIPGDGYIWTPGYWGWNVGVGNYYWVPGAWVLPPRPGLLWTPGYWRWRDGVYGFHRGYWGDRVGFYGGVNYGFGYDGDGYEGGRWQGGRFFYNDRVNNLADRRIDRVYRQDVTRNNTAVSYSGGPGGLRAQPRQGEMAPMPSARFGANPAQGESRVAPPGGPDRSGGYFGGQRDGRMNERAGFQAPGAFNAQRNAQAFRQPETSPQPATGPQAGPRQMNPSPFGRGPEGQGFQAQRFTPPPQAQRFEPPRFAPPQRAASPPQARAPEPRAQPQRAPAQARPARADDGRPRTSGGPEPNRP